MENKPRNPAIMWTAIFLDADVNNGKHMDAKLKSPIAKNCACKAPIGRMHRGR